MKRRFLTLILALALIAIPAQSNARTSWPGFHWSYTALMWVDDDCDSSDNWQISIFAESNGTFQTKLCSWQPNFLDVPMGNTPDASNANDRVSLVQITRWNMNSECKAYFYRDTYYTPLNNVYWFRYVGTYNVPGTYNDSFSSFRVLCIT